MACQQPPDFDALTEVGDIRRRTTHLRAGEIIDGDSVAIMDGVFGFEGQ
jgi:hypothetical protein